MEQVELAKQNPSWTLQNGSRIFYDQGNFDTWCVYVQDPEGRRSAPRDEEYFQALYEIGARHIHGNRRLYTFFLCIYDSTTSVVSDQVLHRILDWTRDFGEDANALEGALVTIYFAMVAEENKRPEYRWPLKKRVKKIGVRQLLIGGATPEEAANGTRFVPWRESAALLEEYEAEDGDMFGRVTWDVLPRF